MAIKELVNAFNLNNYACDKISTNFTVEGKKIVGLFASSTNIGEYLQRMEEKIIKRHYVTREIASEFYNFNYFPFVLGANPNKEYLDNGIVKVKLADSTNNEVIRNLKVHFTNEFKRAVRSKVVTCLQKEVEISEEEAYEWVDETVGTGAIGMPYLSCIAFSNEYLKREYDLETFELFKQAYIKEFNSRLENCGIKSSDFYEYRDDVLYIKDVSDKVVRSVAEYVKGRVALYLGTPGAEDPKVENFKDVLSDFIFKLTGKSIDAYEYDIFTDKKKIENGNDFVLIPLTKGYSGQLESLKNKDLYRINIKYKNLMNNIRGKTAKSDVASDEHSVYAISNKRIAQLLPEIMQSPIAYNQINGCFEFAVDLENFKRRGSSRSSSTVTSPTYAEQPRTPPEQTGARFFASEEDRDSGIGESPPRPKDSVAPSPSGGPSSYFTESLSPTQEFPTRGQNVVLKDSPRRKSEKFPVLLPLPLGTTGVPGTSKEFSPSPQLNSTAVSYGISAPSSSSRFVSSAKNVQAGTSQPIGFWSSQSSNLKEDCKKICEDFGEAYEKIESDSSLSKEEQELFKALLYVFNCNNQILECHHTNFIVENGKIASLIDDSVGVKEYLQAVRDYTIKKYYVTEKEACDLNEFPFKFFSNCKKNQGTTVVANISRGALLNLKELFIWNHRGKVEMKDIDINIVKKAVKSKKDEWVDSQVKGRRARPREAITTCYPDESKLEHIPIIKGKDKYYLSRTFETWEVELFMEERWPAKGTSVAGKGSSKAEEKTSDYYSMSEHTDHEELSLQQQNSSQNTRGRLTRRKSSSPEDGGTPIKFPRRESNNSPSEEEGGLPRSNFSDSESQLCTEFRGANLGRR